MSTKNHYCNLPKVTSKTFSMNLSPDRLEAIIMNEKKWANGTKLKYYFFKNDLFFSLLTDSRGTQRQNFWKGTNAEKEAVKKAFTKWKNVGIGLEFEETQDRLEANIRIGFAKGEGSWSYIGTDCWSISKEQRTINFGWDIVNDQDTILHEIGHAMGLPHEHQNPNAGIVWNEQAVYSELAGSPNFWDHDKTFHNIIRKISPDTVQGSSWDANSIMHYPFGAGLITAPAQFVNGISPEKGLSARDIIWIQQFYPKIDKRTYLDIKPFHSEVFSITAGEQVNFEFEAKETRNYTMRTFGKMDTVMVLSEIVNGENVYLSGDDDSGEDRNSNIKIKMLKGKRYLINLKLYYKTSSGDTCLMLW